MQRYFMESGEVASDADCFSWFDGRMLDASGFLVHSAIFSSQKMLPEIAEAGNAILVAEGGMGKSFVLHEFKKSRPDDVDIIDLALFLGDVQGLRSAIEDGAEKKFLFIDGLDEAMSLCPTLLRFLHQSKLTAHVILASRSIPQLKSFCETLKWPLFSLLPFTAEDVKELCEEKGKNFDAFMREVEGNGLGGVCAKPLGCQMLLTSFDGRELSAKSSEDLWRASLLHLCAENDNPATRPLVIQKVVVTQNECWNFALRSALALKLSGQSVLTRISSCTNLNGNELDFSRLLPVEEHGKFDECLSRQIFSPVGHDKFRFLHSSYFDFLAAMGIVELIDQSEWAKYILSPEGIPYPQWEGVVPWLAARDDALLERVKKSRPDLLLASDAVVIKVGADQICQCILDNAESIPRSVRDNPAIQARYYALDSDECARIVVDALKRSQSEMLVDTAIDIVRRARALPMVDALVEFFCDESKSMDLRVSAGYALIHLANAQQRKKCRSVVSASLPKRLKGVVLRLLWPDFMTVDELVPLLSPGEDNVLDSYEVWVEYEFSNTIARMSPTDKRKLLMWAIGDIDKEEKKNRHWFAAKVDVFLHCWRDATFEENLDLLANGLVSYSVIYFSPFSDKSSYANDKGDYGYNKFAADVERRRRMAEFIVTHENLPLAPIVNYHIRLLEFSDIDFIINEIRSNENAVLRERWAMCLEILSGGIDLPKCTDTWNWLHQEFPTIFKSDANSTMAERKKYKRKFQSIQKKGEKRQADRERREAEIRVHNEKWAHEKLQAGNASKWFRQIMMAIFWQTPKGSITDFGLDFRKSTLWLTFSQQEIHELVLAAYDFVLAFEGSWPKENEFHPPFVQAFYLLMAFDRKRLGALPPDVWEKFAPELLKAFDFERFDLVLQTLQFFVEHQSKVFFSALAKRAQGQLLDGNVELYKFKKVLTKELLVRLLLLLDTENLSDKQRWGLYNEFWRIDPRVTATHVNGSTFSQVSLEKCSLKTSMFVLASDPGKRFAELLQLLDKNTEWGRIWAEEVLGQGDYYPCTITCILGQLSVVQLKVFYTWLLINYPPENEPHHTGCYTPDHIDDLYRNINFVFNELNSRVDPALPIAFEELAAQFPRLWYLKDCALKSRRILLEHNCPTYDMRTIKCLLSGKKDGVIVNTAEDLLVIVHRVFAKYQVYLTGKESPRVSDLWNELNNDKSEVSHKDEESFSDHIKSYLDHELSNLVINREVQLNRGSKDKPGARTDLWVTAISQTDNSRLTLCIEVKGSWNPSCRTAFRDQLCEKYMGAGGANAGIYLVGWFWSEQGCRHKNQWNNDKSEAERYLEEQETELKNQGYNVSHLILDCSYCR